MEDNNVCILDVTKEIDSTEAFTAKIWQNLATAGVNDSAKGANDGFYIPLRRSSHPFLVQIDDAIDGDAVFNSCRLHLT